MGFVRTHRFRFGDIDHAGVAYFPNLLHLCHCTFEDWWADGIGTSYPVLMREHDLGFPVVHLESDFFRPVRFGDDLDVHLGVLRVGRSSAEFGYWMTRAGTDEVMCRMRITTAAVSMATLQKREIPATWKQQFERFRIDESRFPTGR